MQTATTPTTFNPKVSPTLPRYRGPLARFIARQHAATAEAEAAARLATMRNNVQAMLDEPGLFSEAERTAGAVALAACHCLARLQRWFSNVYRLLVSRREAALQLAA